MGLKTLLGEVMDVMGKTECDDEAIEMASAVLKLSKARQMQETAFHASTRRSAERIQAAAGQNGSLAVYDKILERRGSC